jgi:hypothetical protein
MIKSLEQVPVRFELVRQHDDLSGNVRLRYGAGPLNLCPHADAAICGARSRKDGQPVTSSSLRNMPTTMLGAQGQGRVRERIRPHHAAFGLK